MTDIFKSEEHPTVEAVQRMLATCDDTSEYIEGNMIFCRKCVSKQIQDSDGMTEEQKRMFMKKASFFSASQVMALE